VLVVVALALSNRGGESATTVEMAEAQVRAITQTVTGSGKVRPEVEVPLASEVSGEVVFLAVREGDRVQEGQLLVRIRGDLYAAQREQAQAGLLQAQADAARARAERIQTEADLERQRGLHARGVVPQAELEAAQTRAEVSRAAEEAATYRVRSAQASVTQAADQLRRTAIYAPMSGTVSMLNVELGQRVVGTAQMTGTELMRIAELDQMEIEVDINENDVVNVTLGDSARVEVDAYPDRLLRGVVTQIANSARVAGAGTQEQTTNFPVKVQITSAHNQFAEASAPLAAVAEGTPVGVPLLRPGMSGTVDVFTETLDRAVVVPIQAVTVRDMNEVRRQAGEEVDEFAREDLRRVVFVVRDDRAVMVEVTTGLSDDTHIAVLSGLVGGETVVTGPFRVLRTELENDALVSRREPATRTSPRPGR
jgi:HlyD family secretion protein